MSWPPDTQRNRLLPSPRTLRARPECADPVLCYCGRDLPTLGSYCSLSGPNLIPFHTYCRDSAVAFAATLSWVMAMTSVTKSLAAAIVQPQSFSFSLSANPRPFGSLLRLFSFLVASPNVARGLSSDVEAVAKAAKGCRDSPTSLEGSSIALDDQRVSFSFSLHTSLSCLLLSAPQRVVH